MQNSVDNLGAKLVIVTGGAQGLGLTGAEALARAGATVSIWDINGEVMQRAEAELAAEGLNADFRQVDVTVLGQVETAYAAMRRNLGPAGVLINNAGLKSGSMFERSGSRQSQAPPFWELDPDRFLRLVRTNVMGAFHCSRVVVPDMIERRRGSIMNVVTSPHTQVSSTHVPYGPSKSMLQSFTIAAAEQLRPYGVRMNAIMPGGATSPRGAPDPSRLLYDVMVPLTLYLAGDASAEVTGQVFDGSAFRPVA